jgi:hypothetical protein
MVTFKRAHDIRLKAGYIAYYCSPIQPYPINTTKTHKDYHYYATTDPPSADITQMYKNYAKNPSQSTPFNSVIVIAKKDIGWFYVCYKKRSE